MDPNPEYLKLPIIIDIGSEEVKAGFSGEEKPKLLFKNYFGEPKYKKVLRSYDNDIKNTNELFIGNECDKYLGLIKLRYPVNRGVFEKEEDIILLFNHIFSKLDINSQEIQEHPILVTEPILNPKTNRENIAKVLFDKLGASTIFFASQPILSLFSTSQMTGVILESGAGVTQTCAIYEGYSIPVSYERYNYGGKDVTEYLKNMLKMRGYYFYNSSEIKFVNEIKEKMCYLEANKKMDFPKIKKIMNKNLFQYFLPDGNNISIDDEVTLAPEILLNPEYIGKEFLSFSEMISSSINKTDSNLKVNFYNNIWLSGGNTGFRDLKTRLFNELKFPKFETNIYENDKIKPQYRCWVGGNIISILEIFKKMWVTKNDWNEKGSEIIHIKTI